MIKRKYIKYIFGDEDVDYKEEIAIYILNGENPGPPPDIVDGMGVLFNNKECYIDYFDSDDIELDDFLANMNKKKFEKRFFYDNVDAGIFIGIKKIGKLNFIKNFGERMWNNVVEVLSKNSELD